MEYALTAIGVLILLANIAVTHLNFKMYSEYVKDRLVRRRKAGPGEG